jgi:hypothetical protein
MKQIFIESKLDGIGGWLALLQVRMCAGLLALLFMPIHPVLAVLLGGALTLCLLLFYRRRMAFRGAYVVVAALGIAAGLTLLPSGVTVLAVLAALEAVIIPALFLSRRVRITFLANQQQDNNWQSRAPLRCCYDVHLITNRVSR